MVPTTDTNGSRTWQEATQLFSRHAGSLPSHVGASCFLGSGCSALASRSAGRGHAVLCPLLRPSRHERLRHCWNFPQMRLLTAELTQSGGRARVSSLASRRGCSPLPGANAAAGGVCEAGPWLHSRSSGQTPGSRVPGSRLGTFPTCHYTRMPSGMGRTLCPAVFCPCPRGSGQVRSRRAGLRAWGLPDVKQASHRGLPRAGFHWEW